MDIALVAAAVSIAVSDDDDDDDDYVYIGIHQRELFFACLIIKPFNGTCVT